MTTAVCTLLEGDYHYGLGALVNSLYANNFRGTVWAGYRGALPPWANPITAGTEYKSYSVADGCTIRFIELDTPSHFARRKPGFMLDLLGKYSSEIGTLFYLDPDIVVRCRWSFFEEWASCGIALCEDRRSPVFSNGPQRTQWQKFCQAHGLQQKNNYDIYVNSGFIGISSKQADFLKLWQQIQQQIEAASGNENAGSILIQEPAYAFSIPDQDSLNIALSTTSHAPSLLNKQAMGFEPGGFVMCHAIGTIKPWRKHMLLDSLMGKMPMVPDADRQFMQYASGPVRLYSPIHLHLRSLERRLSTLIVRLRAG